MIEDMDDYTNTDDVQGNNIWGSSYNDSTEQYLKDDHDNKRHFPSVLTGLVDTLRGRNEKGGKSKK